MTGGMAIGRYGEGQGTPCMVDRPEREREGACAAHEVRVRDARGESLDNDERDAHDSSRE